MLCSSLFPPFLITSLHSPALLSFPSATIRDAGHWVHAEKPEETLNIIQRYLDEELEG